MDFLVIILIIEEVSELSEFNNKKWVETIKKAYERLLKIRGQPREIALGFALGIFVGFSPTMGFQTILAVFLASMFKWNKISAAIGVWISNPLTAPFIYGLTYFIGMMFLGFTNSEFIPMNPDASGILKMISKAPELIWAMGVGGVVIGLPTSIVIYYISLSAIGKYQADIKEKLEKQKQKLTLKRQEKKRRKKEMIPPLDN